MVLTIKMMAPLQVLAIALGGLVLGLLMFSRSDWQILGQIVPRVRLLRALAVDGISRARLAYVAALIVLASGTTFVLGTWLAISDDSLEATKAIALGVLMAIAGTLAKSWMVRRIRSRHGRD